jgi:hypothetical protein
LSLESLVSKYTVSADKVLSKMEQVKGSTSVSEIDVSKTIEHARAYLEDAKYYKAHKKFETSLTSIAYCEGLLDALRLLGLVKFDWPAKQENEK